MADYDVQIIRGLRFSANRKANDVVVKKGLSFSANRKANDVVVKRVLRFSAKRRRDEWIQNFNGGSGAGSTRSTKRMRFRL